MLLSIALIILLSLLLSHLFQKLRLPALMGMVLTGIILGPYVLNLIDPNILGIAPDLRQIALIIILIRAGLSLDLETLKKIGRPALLLSFIPATIEIVAVMIFAPLLFNISLIEAAILGAVLAAVSPAVIVPRMIALIHRGEGQDKSIPQLIMAGASVDDVYVIVVFSIFIQIYLSGDFSPLSLLQVPLAIVSGVLLGVLSGIGFVWFYKKVHMRDTLKILVMFAIAFLFVALEQGISSYFSISGLIAVMAFAGTILKTYANLAQRLVHKFGKLWIPAEIMLFVLVGSVIDISQLQSIGVYAILLLMIALSFRLIGIILSLIKTNLNLKEKVFVSVSYIPKATVQAAIGAIPLALGVPSGDLILAIAFLSIMITAPLGALLIDNLHLKLLSQSKDVA